MPRDSDQAIVETRPKHKKWIDKKCSKTFRLVHQSQSGDNCDSKHVQQSVEEKMYVEEERNKYGIYFDDDYNYLQHVKDVNEVTENESIVIRQPAEKNLLKNVFEANGYEIDAELLKIKTLPAEMHIDPSMIAELTGDDTENPFENLTNDLDDDFVLQASGGELPTLRPPVSFSLRKNEFREKASNSDDNIDEEMEFASNSDDNIDEEMEFASNYEDDQMSEKDVLVSMQDKKEMQPIDEKFNKLCEEYNETDDEETNEEEEFLLDPNSDRMKMLAEDFKNKNVELVLQKGSLSQYCPKINDEVVEVDEEKEKITIVCPERRKAIWDCETVISAYSNIYNRPVMIVDSPRKQKLKSVLRQIEKMDCSVQSTTKSGISKVSSATIRKRGETAEERKARKAAIKVVRAERRAEKKCNKLTFKEERKKATSCYHGSVIKMLPIV